MYTIAVSGFGNDSDADCIAYWAQHDLIFRGISKDGGGHPICSTYGIGAYPTYILIAPNHDIIIQDMWPISSTQTFVNYFQNNGLSQSNCEPLAAGFTADAFDVCIGNSVNFTDQTTGVPITWNWTFEGGNPPTSTERNPMVSYDASGIYDVELTVSDGVFTVSTTEENYIDVLEYPNTTLEAFDIACVQWAPFPLTGGLPEGGVYSGDFVTDGMFDPAAAGIGDHIITYSYANEAGCESSAVQALTVDACAGIDENPGNTVKIYPNPAADMVNLLSDTKIMGLTLVNYVGQVVMEKSVDATTYQMNTSELASGVYSLKLEMEDGYITKQLVIK